ncbi:hypothetical protein [Thalassobaculum sp.]|uniref:hypothetical protein n=1 Tax=Thalassobaculum sp. TaxID=2022740 RepID=UPI0032EAE69A
MARTVEKNCRACGDNITVRLADHKRGWGGFCDKACSAAFKTGQRPSDVNAHHAKHSRWAAERPAWFERHPPTKAPSVHSQVGGPVHVGKAPKRRQPEPFDGETDFETMQEGWDGHKAES